MTSSTLANQSQSSRCSHQTALLRLALHSLDTNSRRCTCSDNGIIHIRGSQTHKRNCCKLAFVRVGKYISNIERRYSSLARTCCPDLYTRSRDHLSDTCSVVTDVEFGSQGMSAGCLPPQVKVMWTLSTGICKFLALLFITSASCVCRGQPIARSDAPPRTGVL